MVLVCTVPRTYSLALLLHGFMRCELTTNFKIKTALVGVQPGLAINVVADQLSHVHLACMGDME